MPAALFYVDPAAPEDPIPALSSHLTSISKGLLVLCGLLLHNRIHRYPLTAVMAVGIIHLSYRLEFLWDCAIVDSGRLAAFLSCGIHHVKLSMIHYTHKHLCPRYDRG